jgi:SRSO17 transposase
VEWLSIEWPAGVAEPDHYRLSTMTGDIGLERMVDLAKLRWRIERDYLELKQEVGLGHYEATDGAASTITRHSASQHTGS